MLDATGERRRGRPGYGPREGLHLRIPVGDMAMLEQEARRRGLRGPSQAATALVYESLGLEAPAWLTASRISGGVRR